ncbi:MAG TPA: indolepyruvate ferredoxin oxidoreductase subunit alpha [Clostridia bacterium]|nr:indolepyruvate ferredoxin oxidoreductase subunit alpha [Clostridia bacterium]
MKKLLMGNEAIAFGAMKAGVRVVCGYPGTPSSEVLETVAKRNDGSIYVEWSVNEKAAMEIGAGASYTGARVMVTMKQVGLNVASDPLMSLSYIGVKGGMVILVADDPGPNSSQTEQDTRHFAKFANLPVLDPSSPEEAYEMACYAFELSEKTGLPVFLRPTTRICHACGTVEVSDEKEVHKAEGFVKDPKWVIFPALSYQNHGRLEKLQTEIAETFDRSRFNRIQGEGRLGIAASGVAYAYCADVLKKHGFGGKLFKMGTPYPFPENLAGRFLMGLESVMVFEELDPVVEDALIRTAALKGLKVKIRGKATGDVPNRGELSYEIVERAILNYCGVQQQDHTTPTAALSLPARPPVLCAGCPHRASFYAVKQAMKGKKAIFAGDIGCYTLGNAKPLEMVDTCLCMGASVTVAQGIKRVEPNASLFSFIGDSTFFHTGIPGVINALYNGTKITLIVLDNSTTAMTGHQPHPGIGKTMMGHDSVKVSIYNTLKGIGVPYVKRVNPFDLKRAVETVREAESQEGVSAVIFEAPCIAIYKKTEVLTVAQEKCKKCGKCIREIGCPAMYLRKDRSAAIDPTLCYGCGLCAKICPFDAIGREDQ